MIKSKLFKSIFAFVLLFGAFFSINAQNGEPPPEGDDFAPPRRPNLLQELGLSKLQIQQLRRINAEWNPRRQKAQREFREAQRELDEAIYLDESNDSIINQRKEAVKLAHSELINTQTTLQTLIRKVLTNQQLARFRDLRQQFAQEQGNPKNRELRPNNVQNRQVQNQRKNQQVRPLPKRILRPKPNL